MELVVTAFYAGVNAVIFAAMSAYVSTQRIRLRVSLGDGDGDRDKSALYRAVRAQGNAAEYLAIGIVLIALSESLGAPWIALHLMGLALTLGRLFHAYAFLFKGPLVFRQLGTLLTWLLLVVGGLALALHAAGMGALAEGGL